MSTIAEEIQRDADLAAWLREQTWSDFAQSLANFYDARGYLTPKQAAAAQSMRDKADARLAAMNTAAEAPAEVASTIQAKTGQTYTGIRPGIYTVTNDRGHRTFKVTVNREDSDFAPGKVVLSYLAGRDNTDDYVGFAFLAEGRHLRVWKRFVDSADLIADAEQFLADPEAALESVNCIRCNAVLTVPESIALGIGPECAKKGW